MKEKIREIKLTKREKDVIQLISYGYTDSEIAASSPHSIHAIRTLITNLYRKTSTVNRAHLVRWAFERGLLST